MDDKVTITNQGQEPVPVGGKYLIPGERRAVHPAHYRQAAATHPDAIVPVQAEGELQILTEPAPVPDKLTDLTGVGDAKAKKLAAAGYTTFRELARADVPSLMERVDFIKSAEDAVALITDAAARTEAK